MAGKDHSYEIIEQWFDLSKLPKVGSVTSGEVSSVVFVRPVKINLTIIVPAQFIKGKPPKFDIDTCAAVRRLWETLSKTYMETLEAVTLARREAAKDPKVYKEAKDKLDKLNSFFEKSFKQFRPLLRDAVARAVGNGAKAQDLQSIGRVDFKEYEFKPGVFGGQSADAEKELPDLTPAFKYRKWQQCGLIWKGKDAVLVVRRRKEFKAAELKELRQHLPKNKSTGASTLACQFLAESSSNVALGVEDESSAPSERAVILAIKKQCGRTVKVTFGPPPDQLDDEEGEEEEEEKSKGKSKGKGKSTTKETTKEKTKKKSGKKSKK